MDATSNDEHEQRQERGPEECQPERRFPTVRQAFGVVALHIGALGVMLALHRSDFTSVGAVLRITLPALCLLVVAQIVLMARWRVDAAVGFVGIPARAWVMGLPLLLISGAVASRGGFYYLDGVGVNVWIVFVAALAVAALAEELTFRGFLLSALGARMSQVAAIALSSAAFGIAHAMAAIADWNLAGIAPQVLAASMIGVLLALIRLRVGSILLGVVLHFGWNFAVMSGKQTGEATSDGLLMVAVALMLLAPVSAVALTLIHRHRKPSLADVP